MKNLSFILSLLLANTLIAQNSFQYEVQLEAKGIPTLPGLHSFAFAQYNGKILLIGGRKDGLHARQPFNAFPENENNKLLYVLDIENEQVFTKDLSTLPINLQEQLQSTNMNFYQDGNTLYIIGGYGYSNSANNHITFPFLTSIAVPQVIEAIAGGQAIVPYFNQIEDELFAVTGGHLGKIGQTFYLVGGHRFDGRYNPMNMPSFTQSYTDKIQKFSINNVGSQLSISNYSVYSDQVHLHRRDYNLVPQIYPDGIEGYMISSGVFQLNADLPFLYPIDITENGYAPQTSFNQYLSNYHSAHLALYDSVANEMHMLFFGGMAQYYYQNGALMQDNDVPFVKTISLVTRKSDGSLEEFALPLEMPNLAGASAEFVLNEDLPHTESGILKLKEVNQDTLLLGHILGGIQSNSLNPFTLNNTNDTEATSTLYAVKLISTEEPTAVPTLKHENSFNFSISPNPTQEKIYLSFYLDKPISVDYFITDMHGKIVKSQELFVHTGLNEIIIPTSKVWNTTYLMVNLSFADKYYVSKKVLIR